MKLVNILHKVALMGGQIYQIKKKKKEYLSNFEFQRNNKLL